METILNREQILQRIDEILNSGGSRDERLRAVCEELASSVSHYDWVGFYEVNPEAEGELVLGPYVGEPTEHTRIEFGQGICGQAASSLETFIVQDVTRETNYLSCSPDVKSEIVLPVFQDDRLVAELDIDSHELSPFTDADHRFLEEVCRRVAPSFG